MITIPSDDGSEYVASDEEEEEEEENERREKAERGGGRGVAAGPATTTAPSVGGTAVAEHEGVATVQMGSNQGIAPTSTRNDNQETFDERTAGEKGSGRDETANQDQNQVINEFNEPSTSTARQHDGPVISDDIEMDDDSNAQNKLPFDFDDFVHGFLSPSPPQSDIQAELLRSVQQADASGETPENPTAAPATSLPLATSEPAVEPPSNLDTAHVSGKQPVAEQVQGTRSEAESQVIPTTTSTGTAATLPLLRPIEDRHSWKNQQTLIPPMLTPDNDQLACNAHTKSVLTQNRKL
jgi:hypothetical protein